MNKEQLAENAFEKWVTSKEFPEGKPDNVEFAPHEYIRTTFMECFDLLMPIIEKQQKCIEFYASEIYASDADCSPDVYDTLPSDDLEKFIREDGYEYLEAGKLARQTLSEIEAALKEMSILQNQLNWNIN